MLWLQNIPSVLAESALLIVVILLLRGVEHLWSIEPHQRWSDVLMDYKLLAMNLWFAWAFSPLSDFSASSLGSDGLLRLPANGSWFIVSLAFYLLIYDLFLYAFHRAQHAIPALWAMHELHHSAEAMSASTGGRHFWFETVFKTALLGPAFGLVVGVPSTIAVTAGVIRFWVEIGAHMNWRLPPGRLVLVINNPQYHRIHHSIRPEHQNKNFSDLLPIWDIVFGTVWRPSGDEWPATGLDSGDKPTRLLDGVIWPVRHLTTLRRQNGQA